MYGTVTIKITAKTSKITAVSLMITYRFLCGMRESRGVTKNIKTYITLYFRPETKRAISIIYLLFLTETARQPLDQPQLAGMPRQPLIQIAA